jgi:hypothetical protein
MKEVMEVPTKKLTGVDQYIINRGIWKTPH